MKKGIPENSLAAFKEAKMRKIPIEIDIHLTKDNQVVVFHDSDLKRMCGEILMVEESTLEELKQYRLQGTEERIPTLSEVLELIHGDVFLLIEFKVKNNARKLCEEANRILASYQGKYLIQSFYPQVLHWYRHHCNRICRGQLAARFRKEGLQKTLLGLQFFNWLGRPDFISYRHEDYKTPMLRFINWLGAYTLGWTYQTQEDIDRTKHVFDGWIFELFIPKTEENMENKQ
jgi:glycerophosphoryl diester phosphodiesterase